MRFRLRYRLRTLFVLVTLISLPVAWVTHQLSWIRERQDYLTKFYEMSSKRPIEGSAELPQYGPLVALRSPPWPLGWFGEAGYAWMGDPKLLDSRARELFPEALPTPLGYKNLTASR